MIIGTKISDELKTKIDESLEYKKWTISTFLRVASEELTQRIIKEKEANTNANTSTNSII
jgi:hypothetical protein